jgi:hypothetical protein
MTMNRNVLLAALLAILTSGCVTTHTVEAERAPQWLPEAQGNLVGNDATVVLWDGSAVEGTISRMTVDSIWLSREPPARPWQASLQEVSLIEQPRETAGVIGGILGGALIGGLIGAGIGAANPETSEGYVPVLSETTSGMNGGVVGVLVGAPLGGIIVGLLTRANDYQIIRAPLPPKK